MLITNRKIKISLLLAGLAICTATCILVDKELSYYGRCLFPHGKILNYFEVKNMGSFSASFPDCVGLQDDGLPVIAKGSVINGYNGIIVDTIISYGFNDSVVVAQFVSAEEDEYYYIDTPFSYQPIIIPSGSISGKYPTEAFRLTKWVEGVNCAPLILVNIRNMSLLLSVLILIGLLGWVIRNKSLFTK
mgnify:CR=1 FL=1